MTKEQLNSLTEDEQAMLWHIVNEIKPSSMEGATLEFEVFTSIKPHVLTRRVKSVEPQISDVGKEVYAGLKTKLSIE